jgi:hypothetical protein
LIGYHASRPCCAGVYNVVQQVVAGMTNHEDVRIVNLARSLTLAEGMVHMEEHVPGGNVVKLGVLARGM